MPENNPGGINGRPWRVHEKCVVVVDHVATGADMRRARITAGVSQRDLGKALGVSHVYVNHLESGRRNWDQTRVDRWRLALETLKATRD